MYHSGFSLRFFQEAIFCLSVMECGAMHYGINGTFRTAIFTIIAALAGFSVNSEKFIKDLQIISDPFCWAEDNFMDILPRRNYQVVLELPGIVKKDSIKVSFRSVNSILG